MGNRDVMVTVGAAGGAALTLRAVLRAMWGDGMTLRKKRSELFADRVGAVVGAKVAEVVCPLAERLDKHETDAAERWRVVCDRQDEQSRALTRVTEALSKHLDANPQEGT